MWLLMSIENQSDTQVYCIEYVFQESKLAFYSRDQTRNSCGIWAERIERDLENVPLLPSKKPSFIFSITSRITFLFQYINLFLDYQLSLLHAFLAYVPKKSLVPLKVLWILSSSLSSPYVHTYTHTSFLMICIVMEWCTSSFGVYVFVCVFCIIIAVLHLTEW